MLATMSETSVSPRSTPMTPAATERQIGEAWSRRASARVKRFRDGAIRIASQPPMVVQRAQ